MHRERLWSGWKTVDPEKGEGGSELRVYWRLKAKRRRQEAVLDLIARDHEELLYGRRDVEVSDEVVRQWQKNLTLDGENSIYDIRDEINFLASGLNRGKGELGWKVNAPAPISLIRRESSPFTIDAFRKLNGIRRWSDDVERYLTSGKLPSKVYRSEKAEEPAKARAKRELRSWGVVLHMAIRQDGVLNRKYLNLIPLFLDSLCTHSGMTWITFEDRTKWELTVIRHRWLIGPTTLSFLFKHLSTFGPPQVTDVSESKRFTGMAWTAFRRAVGGRKVSLAEACAAVETQHSFKLPPYLIGATTFRTACTSMPERRWRQLLMGSRYISTDFDNSGELTKLGEIKVKFDTPENHTTINQITKSIIDELKSVVYKRRDEKRSSYQHVREELKRVINLAEGYTSPIAQALAYWSLSLHAEKLTTSSIYRYLGAIATPLHLELANAELSKDKAESLFKVYESVLNNVVSQKSKSYKRFVLSRFHDFLVENLDFPQFDFGAGDEKNVIRNADANIVSEFEYQIIRSALIAEDNSSLAALCYWLFTLGYRAGLRIGEALSVAIGDIQLSEVYFDGAEIILIVRQGAYVGVKSYDSRRVLPLHLLLAPEETKQFWQFCQARKRVAKDQSTLLFREGWDTKAPLTDKVVNDIVLDAMRSVTGDSALRFHHLRHSFANNLLLAYHGIEPPWSSPVHLKRLFEGLGPQHTRKGLYFIASLFGHASPSTTLQSYIHVLELIKRYFLNQNGGVSNVKISPVKEWRPLFDVLEIQQDRVRKWKQRYGDDVSQWLSRAYPDVGLKRIDSTAYEPYRVTVRKQRKLRVLSELHLSEIEAIIASQERESSELDGIFRLQDGQSRLLRSAYTSMVYSKRLKGSAASSGKNGQRENVVFRHASPSVYGDEKKSEFLTKQNPAVMLSPPSKFEYWAVSENVFKGIFRFAERAEELENSRKQCLFFHGYHRARDGYIYLPNAVDGLAFTNWVLSLTKGYSVSLAISTYSLSELDQDAQHQFWRKGIGSTRAKVRHVADNKKRKGTHGSAELKFRIEKMVSEDLSSEETANHGCWAVRYGIFMGCVVFAAIRHVRGEN